MNNLKVVILVVNFISRTGSENYFNCPIKNPMKACNLIWEIYSIWEFN